MVPLVSKALHYEERRGPHSVGGHVRDSAAYVCWAFARAYKPEAMADCLPVLTPALLMASCYDRDVSCRRSASAAFQESVGRLGASQFPHGIEILTSADYFTLGSRKQAFLTVGPTIAALPQYLVPLAEHLLTRKLSNWDASVRALAAEALAALVHLQPRYFAEVALPLAIERAVDKNSLEMRHGALLAAAALVQALHDAGWQHGDIKGDAVALALRVHSQDLCRGKGGDLMREGQCKLIATIGRLRAPLEQAQVSSLGMYLYPLSQFVASLLLLFCRWTSSTA